MFADVFQNWLLLNATFFNPYPTFTQLLHDGGPYHIATTPMIYGANQWTGFYMIGTSVMKELTLINPGVSKVVFSGVELI